MLHDRDHWLIVAYWFLNTNSEGWICSDVFSYLQMAIYRNSGCSHGRFCFLMLTVFKISLLVLWTNNFCSIVEGGERGKPFFSSFLLKEQKLWRITWSSLWGADMKWWLSPLNNFPFTVWSVSFHFLPVLKMLLKIHFGFECCFLE